LILVFPLHPLGFASAALALALFGIQCAIIALIGMVSPIGVATKSAILMIDSAPQARLYDGTELRKAIFDAVIVRFCSIMTTTTAALLGAPALCFFFDEGSEPRGVVWRHVEGAKTSSGAQMATSDARFCAGVNEAR
jgi:multidrug efflux pump subunit AcrB